MSWLPKNCVVVPIDFSDLSFDSLAVAIKMVDEPSHLHAVHVLPDLPVTEPGVIWDTIDDAERIDHANDALKQRMTEAGYDNLQTCVRIGDPGHEITQHASDVAAELIVIPSHGRSSLQHLLMGSVTERVVRMAHCPVLVLK